MPHQQSPDATPVAEDDSLVVSDTITISNTNTSTSTNTNTNTNTDQLAETTTTPTSINNCLNIDPMDFEKFVTDKKTILQNDPLREILLYPHDDVSCVVLPRRWRTVNTTVPDARVATTCPLLTRQALLTYASSWNLVHYKYSAYSGSYLDLPRSPSLLALKEDVYEIDIDTDELDKSHNAKTGCITKQGYLLKGPEIGSDRIFVNLASKSFKKRYCYLRQESDGTYVLDIHKDEKKEDAKLSIIMDCCSEVFRNPKRCRNCFEIRMDTGTKGYSFATETEFELEEWMSVFLNILQHNKPDDSLVKDDHKDSCIAPSPIFGTLKGLEHSMNPQLISYAKETDTSIALSRSYIRNSLFTIPSNAPSSPEPQLEPFKEQFGQRILLKCESIKFRLQAPIDGEKELLCQVEPYYTYLALFDARNGRKLTENFYFDLNHNAVKDILIEETNIGLSYGDSEIEPKLNLKTLPTEWFKTKKQAILSINNPHPDIFLVIRIDKILQGSIHQVTEPYVKAAKDPRLGLKVHKSVRSYVNRLGTYKMPFAWAAKPLFRLYTNELDTGPDFPAIYRQEPGRMSDEDLLKVLSEYRKPDKMSKLTSIPGWIQIGIQLCTEQPTNSLTSGWAPVKSFPVPPSAPCSLELASINTSLEHPHSAYVNHLYVYPIMLNFDSQKVYARARNIACNVEIRDSDSQGATSLNLIYGIDGMVNKRTCSVVHHSTNPIWFEEIKIRLPVMLTSTHHLLFTFYHVSCDISKKQESGIETCVGYSWVPLLNKNGKLVDEIVHLPVATHLASGYLSIQPLGLGKGNAGPETVWIDGEKPLFRCTLTLDSTVLTRDPHLHNLFCHAEKLVQPQIGSMPPETETCKILKAAHAIQLTTLIQYLPTIFNQLFEVLAMVHGNSDIGTQVVRLMVHLVHMIYDTGRKDLLESYIKYVFMCVGNGIHEHLMAPLHSFVEVTQQDFLLGHKFMQHSTFFFEIISKSMGQYLINTGRIKLCRTERFPDSFYNHIEKLVEALEPSYVLQQPVQTHSINKNLALFLKKCLNFMDRGFVFKQIKNYINKFKQGDPKALFDFKFIFLQVICYHEHYVAFNLPLQHNQLSSKNWCKEIDSMSPSEEFLQNHFMAGLLLKHVHSALNEAPQKRKLALLTLRDLLAKHELDDRYKSKASRGRIALLYVPWLPIVCDITHRLTVKEQSTDNIGCKKSNPDIHNETIPGVPHIPKDGSLTNNICTPKRNRLTLHFDQCSPVRNSMHFKDSTFFVPLTGTYGNGNMNGNSNMSLESDVSTMSGDGFNNSPNFDVATVKSIDTKDVTDAVNRFGVLSKDEVKDVLFCFLFVLKYLDDEQLINWWRNCNVNQLHSFFSTLELCVDHFKYIGKKKILSECKSSAPDCIIKNKPMKARTLPARMSPPDFSKEPPTLPDKNNTVNRENMLSINKDKENTSEYSALAAGWLSTEVGLVIVDRVCLYTEHLDSANGIAIKPYLRLLNSPQSETLYKHLFASLRAYVNKFSDTLFKGNGLMCGNLVSALLRACDSRLITLRQEATAMLYLLMRGNFEHTHRKGLTRIHLQVIIAVSRMLGNVVSLNNTRFQESLTLINSFASSDKVMKGSGFPSEVKELTRRIRTVLIATEEMVVRGSGGGGGWGAEQERLAELQHTLSVSYRATPRLRHAWLDTMAQHHNRTSNYTEAMCCHLHIAALIAEYLRLRSCQNWGAEAFGCISSNIPRDETGLKIDTGMVDVQYTEIGLLDQMELCAVFVDKAERYELLGPLYRLILPIHEKMRNFEALTRCYQHLTEAYTKVLELKNTGKRLLGRFYRVVFFGHAYFEDEDGVEYIYKELKLTSLSEISERLCKLYEQKFGPGVVKMIMDSAPVIVTDLDKRYAYIQVTSVQPHFDCSELAQERLTVFEKNHDVRRFMYETPFTKDGRAHGNVDEQWKRQTILTTESSFPYVKKRIVVSDTHVEEKNPIEVALEEMQNRVHELNETVNAKTCDLKKLQLRLQGSICVQVNAGPLAYASAFLDPAIKSSYPDEKVKQLKDIFRDFLLVCQTALQINSKVISSDQIEYQEALEQNYRKLCDSLASLVGENITKMQNGNSLLHVVTGAQVDSSTA